MERKRIFRGTVANVFIIITVCIRGIDALSSSSLPRAPRGSAATPLNKVKVAVLGAGGYLGGCTFGFLQRASSLYETGIGNCRCIGATADTALRLNRILGKTFCLAQADESFIKLTDLSSVEAIQNRLEGWDAVILGSDMKLQIRSVTPNTYERTPNDKAWDVYWDEPKGSFVENVNPPGDTKDRILANFFEAAKLAGVKHLICVAHDNFDMAKQLVVASGIPYTIICTPGGLVDTPDYTYQKGIQADLLISRLESNGEEGSSFNGPVCREDLAAVCVQCLQTLNWQESRCISVASRGPIDKSSLVLDNRSRKRVDQQWCVNSFVLEDKLSAIQ